MVDRALIQKRFSKIRLNELNQVALYLVNNFSEKKIWIFEGNMGAGKTTLIKAIGDVLDIQDVVTSPTFALVNEYANKENQFFYHFDFYRINSESEAMDIGAEEYFYSGNLCFIEWAENIPSLIPDDFLRIFISDNSDDTRSFVIETV